MFLNGFPFDGIENKHMIIMYIYSLLKWSHIFMTPSVPKEFKNSIYISILQIWQTVRVQKLESDLNKLNRDLESLKQRLGINYLEDMAEFQKEVRFIIYINSIIIII